MPSCSRASRSGALFAVLVGLGTGCAAERSAEDGRKSGGVQTSVPSAAIPAVTRAKAVAAPAPSPTGSVNTTTQKAPDDGGPRVHAKTRFVWIRSEPDVATDWIGFLWTGGSTKLRSKKPRPGPGCETWYAIEPRGWICVDGRRATLDGSDPVLAAVRAHGPDLDSARPHLYGESIGLERYDDLPTPEIQKLREPGFEAYQKRVSRVRSGETDKGLGSIDLTLPKDAPPTFPKLARSVHEGRLHLLPRSTVAYSREALHGDRGFLLAGDYSWVPKDRVKPYPVVTFQGTPLDRVKLPLAFFRGEDRAQFRRGDGGELVPTGEKFRRLSWVSLSGESVESGGERYLALDKGGLFVKASDAVVPTPRAKTPWGDAVGGSERINELPKGRRTWLEVSILGGWLIAYEDTTPVYATMISAGRGGEPVPGRPTLETASTPTGSFPINGKFATATMEAPGEFVHSDVPWVQNLTGPYALHSAYWHDNWGKLMSAGCVNVSPDDAKWLYQFTEPTVPPRLALRPLGATGRARHARRDSRLIRDLSRFRDVTRAHSVAREASAILVHRARSDVANQLATEHGHVAAGVQPGQILLGKYRIERVLGLGGMGVVVAATHVNLEERVAIKFLLPEALQNAEAVARFLREARAAVRIKSEHVARVTDVGTLETGAPYMIMEYLDGGDLGSLSKARGALPVDDAVEYVLQACEAIAEAHALGIIHRDLKPSNLFVVRRADGTPSVKVLDFGISKVTGMGNSGADLGMTKTTTIMGSPLYMSPEQMASSRDVDARTDLWALGAILFELLTGRVPFQADTITQLCAMILQQNADPLRNFRPDAPEGLQAVVSRCLEKDRNRRYANVADFANALAPFAPRRARLSVERVSRVMQASGLSASSQAVDELLPPSAAPASTGGAWGAATGTQKKSGVVVAVVLGLLVAAGAAAATIVVVKRRAATPEATPSAANPPVEGPKLAAPAPNPAPVEVAPAVVPSPATSSPVAAVTPPPSAAPRPAAKKISHATPPAKPKTAPAPAPAPAPASKPAGKKSDLYGDRK